MGGGREISQFLVLWVSSSSIVFINVIKKTLPKLLPLQSDRTTADSKEKLIFSTDVKGKDVKVNDVKEDSNSDDHSWVDKLGVWPRRIL